MEFDFLKDFNSMLFPVHTVRDYSIKLIDLYPELSRYDVFKQKPSCVNPVKLFKYICLVYDKRSPLRIITDIYKMKYEASLLAEFEEDKNGMSLKQEYIDVIECRNFVGNIWIIWFLKEQGNENYSQLLKYQDFFYSELKNAEAYDKPQDRVASTKVIDDYRKNINLLKNEFLSGDNNENLNQFLRNYRTYEQLNLSAEKMAEDFRNGVDRTMKWNVYR